VTLELRLGRRVVKVSRPEKPLFPSGETKADLAHYYADVAEAMLPQVAGRPLNLERYVDGIDGERLVQQRAGKYFPGWIARAETPKKGGSVEHVVARDAATLVYLAGQAAITLHRWLSRTDRLERPDVLIVDLDPSDPDSDVRAAAVDFGALMRELGLEPFAMTTGSRGFHIVAPLQRRQDYDDVRAFARDLARLAAARDPERLTVEMRKAKRGGRILVDVARNAYAQTAVAPYAVRARPGAPVATPLRWEELEDEATRPDGWTIHTVPSRLNQAGDPWRDIHSAARPLGAPRRKLDALLKGAGLS
jgi:bifunctional non-homologous end joining protein LigD